MRSATVQKFWLSVGLMTAIGSPGLGAVGVLGAMGAIALTSSSVQAAALNNWSFNPSTNQLEVLLPEGVQPRYFLVAEPARIVLDLPSTQVGTVPTEGNYSGVIQQIRVAQFQPDLARIVLMLSPDTLLAPGQVKLEKIGSVEQGTQRWALRPLVADASAPIASGTEQTQPVVPNPVSPSPVAPPPITGFDSSATSSDSSPLPDPALSSVSPGLPPAMPTPAAVAATVAVPESASLPPAPSSAVPLSTEIENSPEEQRDRSQRPSDRPSTRDRQATTANRQARRSEQQAQQAAQPSDRPSVQSSVQPPTQLSVQPPTAIAQTLPPATFTPTPAGSVNVPALEPPAPPAAPATLASTSDSIPFGQPLPDSATGTPPAPSSPEPTLTPDRSNENSDENSDENFSEDTSPPLLTEIAVDSTFNTLIPADTELSLYYPQETPLELTTRPQEEVLFLAQNVRDRAGNLLIPIDSQVIGSFESSSAGSRFLARSIRIEGENRPISAESEPLDGSREVSRDRVVRTSAVGAVAGLLLGLTTGIGALAGLALGGLAGAGSVFVSAPQAAVIEPNQIIEVRLLEDLPR